MEACYDDGGDLGINLPSSTPGHQPHDHPIPCPVDARSRGAAVVAGPSRAQDTPTRVVITKQADLPRFSYPIEGTATAFVEADTKTFDVFAAKVGHDVDGVLAGYQIDDKSTRVELLGAKLGLQELSGDYAGGLETIDQLRTLQTKPAAKALTGLFAAARLRAAIEAGGESGPAFEAAFRKHYDESIAPLPWAVVKDGIKSSYGYSRIAGRAATLGNVTTELDPAVTKSGALDSREAWELLDTRVELKFAIPVYTCGPTCSTRTSRE